MKIWTTGSLTLPKIIGIHGKKQTGKDTLGDFLVKHCGYVKISFADLVKKAAAVILDLPVESLEDEEVKQHHHAEVDMTVREFLQKFGTDAMRGTFGHSFWLNMTRRKIDKALKHDVGVVITDVRFPNELEMLRDMDALLMRVWTDTDDDSKRVHVSELGLERDLFDINQQNTLDGKTPYLAKALWQLSDAAAWELDES